MVDTAKAVADAPQGERLTMMRALANGDAAGVNREAKPNGAILGLSVITKGVANWGWIDEEFLESVVALGNKTAPRVKSRFTHPGLSSDGLGKLLGRVVNFRRQGNKVLGDEFFTESASQTPDGDLAAYVMKLTEETPDLVGTSIVFWHDLGAEDRFKAEHTDEDGNFVSPDPENTGNLPHWRISKLDAVDVVDDPAANPDGMFSRGSELPREGEAALDYAFGLSDEQPARALFGQIHPERARRFVTEYLARKGLALTKAPEMSPAGKESHMSEEKKKEGASGTPAGAAAGAETSKPEPAVEEAEPLDKVLEAANANGVKAESERFAALKEAFPDRLGFAVEQFEAGSTVAEAKAAFRDVEIAELKAENVKLRKAEGVEPLGVAGDPDAPKDVCSLAKELRSEDKKLTVTESLRLAHKQIASA